MGKILPILLALIGLGAGVGAGIMLRPDPAEIAAAETPCGPAPGAADAAHEEAPAEGEEGEPEHPTHEYVKLNNQFIVPIVTTGEVRALVIMSLSLEVKFGLTEKVYQVEPKLRDAFLQALFDHANTGGFDGAYTSAALMEALRKTLMDAAVSVMGEDVTDVLVSDIIRQDQP